MADSLVEFRRQYPQYADMTDAEVAANLIQDDPQKWTPLVGKYVDISLSNPQTMFGNIRVPQTAGLGDPTATKTTPGALALEGLRTTLDIGLPTAGAALMAPFGLIGMGGGAAAGSYAAHAARGNFVPDLSSMGLDAALGALGGLPAKFGAMAVARPDAAGREALAAAQSFKRPIHLTASEQSGKSGVAQFERFPERFPSAATRYGRYAERRHAEVASAAGEILGEAGSPVAIDEAGAIVKRSVRALGEADRAAAEQASIDLIHGIGRPVGRTDLGERWLEDYKRLSAERRAIASAKYDASEAAVEGQTVPATHLRAAGQSVMKNQEILGSLAPRQPSAAARGVLAATQPSDLVASELSQEQMLDLLRRGITPQGTLSVADLPTELVQKYGLNQPRELSFKQLRALQSELWDYMQRAQSDKARRGIRELFEGVSADIDAFNNPLIDEANQFYKKDVAALFGRNSRLRKLSDMSDTDRIGDKLLSVDSPSQVRAMMAPLSVDEANVYRATFLQRIHDAGINVETNAWDPAKYLRATAGYSDDTMKTLLGPSGFSRYEAIRDGARASVAKMDADLTSSRILAAQDEKVLGVLVRNHATQDVTRMMASFDEPTKAAARAGKWQEMISAAENKQTGGISLARLNTQLADIDPATRQAFFGDRMASRIGQLQKVLQRIGHTGAMSANPSETAKGIGGMSQIQGVFQLGTRVATGLTVGGVGAGFGVPAAIGTGIVLLTPSLIGRLTATERGIALLTQGLIAKPGTQAATRVLSELAVFGMKEAGE